MTVAWRGAGTQDSGGIDARVASSNSVHAVARLLRAQELIEAWRLAVSTVGFYDPEKAASDLRVTHRRGSPLALDVFCWLPALVYFA